MRTTCRLMISFVLVFSLLRLAVAQDNRAANAKRASEPITAFASTDRVRFTAPSSVVQMHLEVYTETAVKLFDFELKGGNVLDWHLQNGQAERISPGFFLCVVTVKNLSGKLAQRIGSINISGQQVTIEPAPASKLSTQQAQAIGPLEEDSSLTVLKDDDPATTAVIAHNGEEGKITRGKGALSFRLGDFLRGKDQEQMRLTPEGNLGIGITLPQARLDVDGLIRTSQGILFPDGTIQTTAAVARTSGRNPNGTVQPGQTSSFISQTSSGKAAKDKKKFSPELFVNEDLTVNGNIIFTPPSPQFTRDITMQNNNGGLRFYGAPTLTNSPPAAAIQFWGNNSPFPGQLYLDAGAHDSGAVIIRSTGTGGTIAERMRVTATGNVGIGTNPIARLAVRGDGTDVLVGSAGCPEPTAAIGFGAMSGCADFALSGDVSNTGNAGIYINRPTGRSIHFRENNGPDQMTIVPGGRVGIGTTNPKIARLQVEGGNDVGVYGTSNINDGVFGASSEGNGVEGQSLSGSGVAGQSLNGIGVVGFSGSITGYGGFFFRAVGIVDTFDQLPPASYLLNVLGSRGSGPNQGVAEFSSDSADTGVRIKNLRANGRTWTLFSSGGGSALGDGTFHIYDATAGQDRFAIDSAGNVYIPVLGPGGTTLCHSGSKITNCSSSLRYKKDSARFTRGLDLLSRLRPISFTWKDHPERDLGLGAEDVAAVEPLLVTHNVKGEVEGVKYDRLTVVLINAIKEQQSQIEQQHSQIENLRSRLSKIERIAEKRAQEP